MDIKVNSIDSFLFYYFMGYNYDKEDIKFTFGISEKTFYRKINHKDHDLTKVKISKPMREKIRSSFIEDDRLTNAHMYTAEKKVLFNTYEVLQHLMKTGEFELYINQVRYNLRNTATLYNKDNEKYKQHILNNYEAILFYLMQAKGTKMLNLLGLSDYKDLHTENERIKHRHKLNMTPHLRFVVCGVTKYVLLEYTRFAGDDEHHMYRDFMRSFERDDLPIDPLFYTPVDIDF